MIKILHLIHMKTITINVSKSVYRDFQQAAKRLNHSASALIREAMEQYRREHLQPRGDLRGFRPRSLGRMTRPSASGDYLLAELLNLRA